MIEANRGHPILFDELIEDIRPLFTVFVEPQATFIAWGFLISEAIEANRGHPILFDETPITTYG